MRIADLEKLRAEHSGLVVTPIRNPQSAIRNRKKDGRPAPAHSKKPGAKWVKVRTRRASDGRYEEESDFENVASNTR
jgi:hypothetical protein